MKNQDKVAYWQQLFKKYDESKLSISAFCKKKQVKRPTYHYWINGSYRAYLFSDRSN